MPVADAVHIAVAVANALEHAHRKGVVHRDVKPANIMLQDGEPVVADFGIALAVDGGQGRLTETGLSIGTPFYMSPEQATGDGAIGPASDVYSLACVLYEMLAGQPPHDGASAQAILARIIAGDAEPVRTHAPPRRRTSRPPCERPSSGSRRTGSGRPSGSPGRWRTRGSGTAPTWMPLRREGRRAVSGS